jgi:transposase
VETTDIKAYSKDLRLKVLDAVDREMPRKQVALIFGVSLPSIKRWLKRRRESGDVEPSPGLVLRPERVKARDRQWKRTMPDA